MAEFGNAKFSKFDESVKVESNQLSGAKAREAGLAPAFVAQKKAEFDQIFNSVMQEFDDAEALTATLQKIPVGSCVRLSNGWIIKNPSKDPEKIPFWIAEYINKLEKTAIGLSQKLNQVDKNYQDESIVKFISRKTDKLKRTLYWKWIDFKYKIKYSELAIKLRSKFK